MERLRGTVVAALLCCVSGCSRPVGESSVLTAAQIADRARPATVAITAQFEVVGTVPRMELDTAGMQRWISRHSYANKQEMLESVFNAFLNRPGDYLKEGETIRFRKTISSLGTGFIVTPDGYILTNAHVVQPEDEDLKAAAVESMGELVNDDVERLQRLIAEELPGDRVDEGGIKRLRSALTTFYAHRADIRFNRQIAAILPSAQGDSADKPTIRICELKQMGKPTPGKDVAVLKIEGNDLPTIPLAPPNDQDGTRVGSELLVFGYPGKVALDTNFTLQSRMQPSLTIGHVSGTKRMEEGWDVIQTDASVNPGNSGGPAMNDRGQVVGLATFGFLESQGLNFAVSIDVARQFLNEMNVQPRQSAFTQKYNVALAQFDRPRHGDALRLFSQLHTSHPEIGPVTDFTRQMTLAQPETPTERPQRSGPPPIVFIGLGAAVIGLLVLIVASSRS